MTDAELKEIAQQIYDKIVSAGLEDLEAVRIEAMQEAYSRELDDEEVHFVMQAVSNMSENHE